MDYNTKTVIPAKTARVSSRAQHTAIRKKAFEIVCNYLYGNLTKPRDGHDILHSQKKEKMEFQMISYNDTTKHMG